MEEITRYKPETSATKIEAERIDRESLRDKCFIVRDYIILQSTLAENSYYAVALIEYSKKNYSVILPSICADKLKNLKTPVLVKLVKRISQKTKRQYWDFAEAD